MSGVALVPGKSQLSDSNGNPLAGGTVDVYLAGTTTRTNSWQDQALTSLNTNPIVLDASGSCSMWLDGSTLYKLVVKNATGATQSHLGGDNISGAAGSGALVSFLQSGTGAVSRSAQDKMREVVSAKDFGAVASPTTNNSTFIQAAIDAVYAAGGGEVILGAGTFGVSNALKLYPGVVLRGKGRDSTTIKVQTDDVLAFDRHPLSRSGNSGLYDLTIWGYGDRNTTQGTDANRLAVVGPFDSFEARRVRCIYSRYVSILADASKVVYDDNDVEKSLRDGLQVYNGDDVQVTNNRISEVADDGIAVHISTAGVTKRRVVVTGNRLTKCTGIKVLGAQRAVIDGNNLHLCYGYGVFLGLDANFGEGFVTPFDISVQNNVFTDTLGLLPVNGQNGVAVVYLTATRSLGAGGSVAPAYPGTYNAASGAFVLPDTYINTAGLNNPRAPSQGIVIRGNIIKQTLSGLTNIADAGFGNLWWTAGSINPAFVTNIGIRGGALLRGIMVEGDLEGANIAGNHIEGVSEAMLFRNFDVMQSVLVTGNTIRRCKGGISVDIPSARHVGWTVEGNDIDIDPYHEGTAGAGGRTTPLNGTWKAVAGSDYMGVTHTSTIGAVIRRNRFRNCLKATHGGGGSVAHIAGNVYEFDWSGGATLKGIGNIAQELGNTCLYRDCDPTSVTFGQYSTTADSGFVLSAGSVPASGYYRIGQFVQYIAPAINGSGRYLQGWYRLTNGNAHVAGTDWAQVWVSNASWL